MKRNFFIKPLLAAQFLIVPAPGQTAPNPASETPPQIVAQAMTEADVCKLHAKWQDTVYDMQHKSPWTAETNKEMTIIMAQILNETGDKRAEAVVRFAPEFKAMRNAAREEALQDQNTVAAAQFEFGEAARQLGMQWTAQQLPKAADAFSLLSGVQQQAFAAAFRAQTLNNSNDIIRHAQTDPACRGQSSTKPDFKQQIMPQAPVGKLPPIQGSPPGGYRPT